MKRWHKILFWTVAPLLLAVIALFGFIYHVSRPTTGERIGTYASPRTALLVIDIQEDYTGPRAVKRFRDGDRIVAASNQLLTEAQASGVLVIFIQNVIDNPVMRALAGGMNAPGAPGTEMDRRLLRVAGARTFTKGRPDAFSNPELDAYLRQNQVDTVLVTGLDGAYCVTSTVRGALNRGYRVTVHANAVATESGKTLEELSDGWRAAGAQVR